MNTVGLSKVTAAEVVILDSNIFIEEAGLTSKDASALKHYLYHQGTQLVVPEVIAEECERTLATVAKGKKRKVEKTLEWLGRFCGRVNGWQAPSDEAIEERAKALAEAHHLGAIVLPEADTVRARAESRNQAERPPSHRDSGLNDCRIWEQCLELLADHDVVFVSADRDFCGHGSHHELHPQLQAEAEEVARGRILIFHSNIESLLSGLRSQLPSIPKEVVFAFIYDAVAVDIQELVSNSGCRPKMVGDVTQILLTTDRPEVIEVRLEVDDRWESPDGTRVADFRLRGSCHYFLADEHLSDLRLSRVALLVTEPDGSVRAVTGSYTNLQAHFYAGASPIQPEPEILG